MEELDQRYRYSRAAPGRFLKSELQPKVESNPVLVKKQSSILKGNEEISDYNIRWDMMRKVRRTEQWTLQYGGSYGQEPAVA